MRILKTIETVWLDMVLRASQHWTSQISYDVAASLLQMLSDRAEAPEVVRRHIDDDTYDKANCYAASQPTLDLIRSATYCCR